MLLLLGGCGGDENQPHLAQGRDRLARGELTAAVIEFKNAVKQEPLSAEAHFQLALALRRTVEVAAAEIELRKAASLGMNTLRVNTELAGVLTDLGRGQEAVELLTAATATEPEDVAALESARGDALLTLGRKTEARKAFEGGLRARPDHGPAKLGLARVALAEGSKSEGEKSLDTALAAAPDLALGWLIKGNLLAGRNQLREAADAYGKAIALRPGELRAFNALVPTLVALGDITGATQRVEQMRTVAPMTPAYHYLLALVLHRKGKFAQAREEINLVLKAVPDDLRALMLAGTVELDMGNAASAEERFTRLVGHMREEPQARRLLAAAQLQRGHAAEASKTLAPLLASSSEDPATWMLMAQVQTALRQWPKAIDALEKVVALNPRDALALARLGDLLHVTGRREEGDRRLGEGAALAPDSIPVAEVRIRRALQDRAFDRARDIATALASRRADRPEPPRLLAGVNLAAGDRAAARLALEAALKLDPDFAPATRDLVNLDLAEGRSAEARQRLEAALERNPRHEDSALLLLEVLRAARASREEVLRALDQAILGNASSPRLRVAKVDYLAGAGDRRAALEAAQAAHEALRDEPTVLLALARAQAASRQWEQAASSYGKLAAMAPDSDLPVRAQAGLQLQQGDAGRARDTLRRAINEHPERVPLHLALVATSLKSGDLNQAEKDARALREKWPDQGAGYAAVASVQAASGDQAGAERTLREGVARTGENDLVNRLLALLATRERLDAAEQEASAWVARHPADATVMSFMGSLRAAHGDHQQAVAWFQRAQAARGSKAPANP